jgi:hypothetical protein
MWREIWDILVAKATFGMLDTRVLSLSRAQRNRSGVVWPNPAGKRLELRFIVGYAVEMVAWKASVYKQYFWSSTEVSSRNLTAFRDRSFVVAISREAPHRRWTRQLPGKHPKREAFSESLPHVRHSCAAC